MSILFVYDAETTGFPLWNEPSDHPDQPHLVQLAAAMVDSETRDVIQSLDVIIKPDGWVITEETSKVHGITQEYAESVGIPERMAVQVFYQLWLRCNGRAAHNEQFDQRILRIALKRYFPETIDHWKAGKAECTARLATPFCQLPPTEKMKAAGRFHYKTPNLSEAYKYFMGEELKGAHNAMVDVKACMDVWFAIRKKPEHLASTI